MGYYFYNEDDRGATLTGSLIDELDQKLPFARLFISVNAHDDVEEFRVDASLLPYLARMFRHLAERADELAAKHAAMEANKRLATAASGFEPVK